ncbi:hypothetical protein KKG72_01570 [bacterium]|nr:hypothetical protein [bacterium]MBU1993171.1 hypothetical protein [bacterium]
MKCRFCDIVNGNYKYQDVDKPFSENDDFFAIASIGSMVEGWSLIIPKKHQLSMRNVYSHKNFKKIINEILPLMSDEYGNIISFEHGSNEEGSITACGTDHAHLHLVPYKSSLVNDLKESGLKWEQCLSSEIKNKTANQEYLFYSDINSTTNWEDPVGYLHILEHPISQYFRHLLAKKIDKVEESDYKIFPFLENAVQTRLTFNRLIA